MAAGLSVKPSLQEGLTSLDNLKDNRAGWFLYNVHTWTGNRLLSSTQPPQSHYFWTAAILTFTQSRDSFLKLVQQQLQPCMRQGARSYSALSPQHGQFPQGSFPPLFNRQTFCRLKRHKRLHTLPLSLYKSSAEEDSRRSDILKPNLKA